MVISSRTPEGTPNSCPVCGAVIEIDPSDPAGDAPCPRCGQLLWFLLWLTWDTPGDIVVMKPTSAFLGPESLDMLADGMSEHPGRHVVLDLSNVQYVTSAALGKLVQLKKKVKAVRRRLRIENLRPELLEVFLITRLDQVFDIRR